ncbi:hypothetical protein GCM10022404_22180 [Celeribacter arenosi]|uniref:Regulatory protein SoxS n=2 Tax=Celeribacter arenosi TaxID=792649 RepID=A0ABP7KC11_9RHOB
MDRFILSLAAALFVLFSTPLWAMELVMAERDGCAYCARWNAEIAPIYPKTPEGVFAPLRRMDISERPEDIEFVSRPFLTPTFVLVDAGKEIGRIEGYGGDEMFWAMLTVLLRDHTDFDIDALNPTN